MCLSESWKSALGSGEGPKRTESIKVKQSASRSQRKPPVLFSRRLSSICLLSVQPLVSQPIIYDKSRIIVSFLALYVEMDISRAHAFPSCMMMPAVNWSLSRRSVARGLWLAAPALGSNVQIVTTLEVARFNNSRSAAPSLSLGTTAQKVFFFLSLAMMLARYLPLSRIWSFHDLYDPIRWRQSPDCGVPDLKRFFTFAVATCQA